MNQTSASPSGTSLSNGTDIVSLLTSAHLIWLALVALLVVAAIVYGSRQKRRRDAAERQMAEHSKEAGIEPQPAGREEEAPLAQPAAPAPAAVPLPAPDAAPPATSAGDDPAAGPVTQLKGLGPKVAARLAELGITTVGQIAALDHDAAARLDAQLGAFKGRMERDRWIEQARFLAAGDVKGFEAVFGRL